MNELELLISKSTENYCHFDFPLNKDQMKRLYDQLVNHQLVKCGNWRSYPFIAFDIEWPIFRHGERTTKLRPIALTAHHDAFIYRYYGLRLNKTYDGYLQGHSQVNQAAVAYRLRDPKRRLSNITVAKMAFDQITLEDSLIIKGDFSHFFDNLDHQILRQQLKRVLSSGDKVLSDELFKVVRVLYRYRYIEQAVIEEKVEQRISRSGHAVAYDLTRKGLGQMIKSRALPLSPVNKRGIPQGTALSGILANIYMLAFDQAVSELLAPLNGRYWRYSDDFIIVLPARKVSDASKVLDQVIGLSRKLTKLTIKKAKTGLFRYSSTRHELQKYRVENQNWSKSSLNYLGFNFDGQYVGLGPKTIYRFDYRSRDVLKRYETYIAMDRRIKGGKSIIHKVLRKDPQTHKMHWRTPNSHECERQLELGQKVEKMGEYGLKNLHRDLVNRYLSPSANHRSNSRDYTKQTFIDYAKRSQCILKKGKPNYQVRVLKQANKIIHRRQKELGKFRK